MVFEKIFVKKEGREEGETDYFEVNVSEAGAVGGSPNAAVSLGKIGIRLERLGEFADTERILKQIREGSIIFLKIKALKEKDIGELKRSVERLKKTVVAQGGDIVGVEEDWLVLTPEHAIVHR